MWDLGLWEVQGSRPLLGRLLRQCNKLSSVIRKLATRCLQQLVQMEKKLERKNDRYGFPKPLKCNFRISSQANDGRLGHSNHE